ncbi:MAG: hypothetical protein NC341_04115 [Blautia sp.]|nr:hypothetical protein [Blautia sp.]MCM1200783.1 hypothetical protein [Bacteroides fragilis]
MKKRILKLGIIGAYGGQGRRIISCMCEETEKEYIVYEHDVMKKREHLEGIEYTIKDSLDSLLFCDGIIIAAPTAEHFYYLNYLIEQNYKGYIFCEKPPVETTTELQMLRHIGSEEKKKILFGFNLRYSIYQQALEGWSGYDLGELRHCSVISGHGLGYKDSYKNSWRNNKGKTKNGIFETVSIHYLDMFIDQFGKPLSSLISPSIKAEAGMVWDNIMYNAVFMNGITLNVFNSYVSPFINETRMIFENGIIEINRNTVRIYYPRECFDDRGQYTTPPIVYEAESQNEIWEEAQKEILKVFLITIRELGEFSEEDFERALDTTEYILQITKDSMSR